MRRIVVGYSGGVTSAWCLGWALRHYPRHEVIALFHDTKAEDEDTYRFLREMAVALNVEVTERSDGRSVEQVEDDENALANNRMAFCSRILKAQQRQRYFKELRAAGVTEIEMLLGFTKREWMRIQRHRAMAERDGYAVEFPVALTGTTKQQCADWCVKLGVRPPNMYRWSEHANCPGCRRGGKAYWLAVKQNRPDVFQRACDREAEFGFTIINGTSLVQLAVNGMKRTVKPREAIEIGTCECGD